jgi:hypothetical protein
MYSSLAYLIELQLDRCQLTNRAISTNPISNFVVPDALYISFWKGYNPKGDTCNITQRAALLSNTEISRLPFENNSRGHSLEFK